MFGAILTANQPKGAVLGIIGLGALGHLGVQVRFVVTSFLVRLLIMQSYLVCEEHGVYSRRCRCTR